MLTQSSVSFISAGTSIHIVADQRSPDLFFTAYPIIFSGKYQANSLKQDDINSMLGVYGMSPGFLGLAFLPSEQLLFRVSLRSD